MKIENKSTAKLEYRTHVPYGWIASRFCHIDFFGYEASELKDEWYEIRYDMYDKNDKRVSELKKKLEKIKLDYTLFEKVTKGKEYKINLSKKRTLEREMKEYKKGRFYTASMLSVKAESFLKRKGFVIISHDTDGGDGGPVTTTEIYERLVN